MNPEMIVSTIDLFGKITNLLNSQKVEYRVIEHKEIDGSATGSSDVTRIKPE